MVLTKRQEDFTRYIFEGSTQRDAWIRAGYSSRYALDKVDQNACTLFNSRKIQGRFKELNQAAVDDSIATVTKRKQRLTEFLTENILSDKGVKLRDSNIRAVAELNRMERVYEEKPDVNIDARQINVYVTYKDQDGETAGLLEQVKERTKKLLTGE